MRPPRVLAIGVIALSTVFATALIGRGISAAATTINYVALGDSYAAGVGAGGNSGSCNRTDNAYPALWAAANSPASFTFAACSGATTSDVISSQLSALSSATTLVSLTVGGDDAGFTSIMETCVLGPTSSCESAVSSAESSANNTLPGKLGTLLSDIHSDAPNAKVVVLGYPDFYDTSVSDCVGLSSADHTAIDTGIDDLDGIIQAAAANNNATFADVRSQFSGQEICDSPAWLHSLNITDIPESYHPTAAGQSSGYLPVFSAAAASVGQ
jgi:lysophospholipase L1-like esterase